MSQLLSAVGPFLKAAQEGLPAALGTSTFNLEVGSRMIVPANTHLRDIVASASISHYGVPSPEGVQAVTVLPHTMPLGGQSEAAGPPFTFGRGRADEAGPSHQRAKAQIFSVPSPRAPVEVFEAGQKRLRILSNMEMPIYQAPSPGGSI